MPLSDALNAVAVAYGLSAKEVALVVSALSSSPRNREEICRTAMAVMRKVSGKFHVNLRDGQVTDLTFELTGREFARLSAADPDGIVE